MAWRFVRVAPMADECPNPRCRLNWSLFPPIRVYEAVMADGHIGRFQPGPNVRCVECKMVFDALTHELTG